MDLALNNLKRVDMPLNKETNSETKPMAILNSFYLSYKTSPKVLLICLFLIFICVCVCVCVFVWVFLSSRKARTTIIKSSEATQQTPHNHVFSILDFENSKAFRWEIRLAT